MAARGITESTKPWIEEKFYNQVDQHDTDVFVAVSGVFLGVIGLVASSIPAAKKVFYGIKISPTWKTIAITSLFSIAIGAFWGRNWYDRKFYFPGITDAEIKKFITNKFILGLSRIGSSQGLDDIKLAKNANRICYKSFLFAMRYDPKTKQQPCFFLKDTKNVEIERIFQCAAENNVMMQIPTAVKIPSADFDTISGEDVDRACRDIHSKPGFLLVIKNFMRWQFEVLKAWVKREKFTTEDLDRLNTQIRNISPVFFVSETQAKFKLRPNFVVEKKGDDLQLTFQPNFAEFDSKDEVVSVLNQLKDLSPTKFLKITIKNGPCCFRDDIVKNVGSFWIVPNTHLLIKDKKGITFERDDRKNLFVKNSPQI